MPARNVNPKCESCQLHEHCCGGNLGDWASEIGDQPAFPTAGTNGSVGEQGMTYRQWVVGQALAGLSAWGDADGCLGAAEVALMAFASANCTLNRLARDEQKREEDRPQHQCSLTQDVAAE